RRGPDHRRTHTLFPFPGVSRHRAPCVVHPWRACRGPVPSSAGSTRSGDLPTAPGSTPRARRTTHGPRRHDTPGMGARHAAGLSGEAGVLEPVEAFYLVYAFVVSYLAEQVGPRVEVPVIVSEFRIEWDVLPLRMLRHQLHVLMLCVIFEVRVEQVRPVWSHHEQEPG